ncbi:YebC/PmpR family DNA-binding transcriptional regulator [Candidatus Woesebacteria bacterium]|nr:YebC/PmpR family DNA-binding transcriptional regulator [Candidatus Woesebacteria bacterium]
MSGHSHYATIHRQKEAKDAQKGQIFSKLAKEIAIAVKSEGPDPSSNFKLRVAMDRARAANMPKDNVERAISSGSSSAANLEETIYEGFGPSGIAVMVSAATDNRNRTSQEVKNLFERAGGRLAGPGSVSFNFENKGLLVIEKKAEAETQMLTLIDMGVEDIEETDDGLEVYVSPDKLTQTRKKLQDGGFSITSTELFMKPKNLQTISDPALAKKALAFLESLEEHEDVQRVYANLDIPDAVLSQVR